MNPTKKRKLFIPPSIIRALAARSRYQQSDSHHTDTFNSSHPKKDPNMNQFNNTPPEWFQDFEQLLQYNMSNPHLTNTDMAAELGISVRELYRKVKATTGLSPNLYFRRLRLQEAHDLLEVGAYLTVKEVVDKVGFVKIAYFYKIFKQEFGYPPGELLRRGGFK